jgi:hypothetical protein
MTRSILGTNRAAILAAAIAMQEAELAEKFRPVNTCNVDPEPEPANPRADRRRKEKAARKQRQKQGKRK